MNWKHKTNRDKSFQIISILLLSPSWVSGNLFSLRSSCEASSCIQATMTRVHISARFMLEIYLKLITQVSRRAAIQNIIYCDALRLSDRHSVKIKVFCYIYLGPVVLYVPPDIGADGGYTSSYTCLPLQQYRTAVGPPRRSCSLLYVFIRIQGYTQPHQGAPQYNRRLLVLNTKQLRWWSSWGSVTLATICRGENSEVLLIFTFFPPTLHGKKKKKKSDWDSSRQCQTRQHSDTSRCF